MDYESDLNELDLNHGNWEEESWFRQLFEETSSTSLNRNLLSDHSVVDHDDAAADPNFRPSYPQNFEEAVTQQTNCRTPTKGPKEIVKELFGSGKELTSPTAAVRRIPRVLCNVNLFKDLPSLHEELYDAALKNPKLFRSRAAIVDPAKEYLGCIADPVHNSPCMPYCSQLFSGIAVYAPVKFKEGTTWYCPGTIETVDDRKVVVIPLNNVSDPPTLRVVASHTEVALAELMVRRKLRLQVRRSENGLDTYVHAFVVKNPKDLSKVPIKMYNDQGWVGKTFSVGFEESRVAYEDAKRYFEGSIGS